MAETRYYFEPLSRSSVAFAAFPSSVVPSAFSSSSFRYFLLLFFDALALFFLLTSPTIAARLWSPFRIASSFAASRSRAILRFCSLDRVAWDLTTTPVGRCLSWTAELVLFCFAWKSWLTREMTVPAAQPGVRGSPIQSFARPGRSLEGRIPGSPPPAAVSAGVASALRAGRRTS